MVFNWTESSLGPGLVLTPVAKSPRGISHRLHCVDRSFTADYIKVAISSSKLSVEWQDIYVIHQNSTHRDSKTSGIPRADMGIHAPFRFQHLERQVDSAYRWEQLAGRDLPWTGKSRISLYCSRINCCLHLGRCTAQTQNSAQPSGTLGPHWAYLESTSYGQRQVSELDTRNNSAMHDCPTDHICDWPQRTRACTIEGRLVGPSDPELFLLHIELSFAPCPMNPSGTLVVHLHILGGSDTDGTPYDQSETLSDKARGYIGNAPRRRVLNVAQVDGVGVAQ